MSFTIAVTGKGGVGKTTISSIIINRLIALNRVPILAVDADPNSCLDANLGIKVEKTIGGVREEAREIAGKGMSAGISKQELLEFKIAESLVESENFDLIAMGRPEGPGCYCYANNVLKQVIGVIADSYPFVVIDNEAGLENLSRRIVQEVDLMVMVADPSMRGLDTLERLYELAGEMGIKYNKLILVVNRMRHKHIPEKLKDLENKSGANMVLLLPDDDEIASVAEKGESIFTVSDKNSVLKKIEDLLLLMVPKKV